MGFWRWIGQLAGIPSETRSDARAPLTEEGWPEWQRRWAALPHRRLDGPIRHDFGPTLRPWGEPVAATIALVPPEQAHHLFMKTKRCPICGRGVGEPDRRPAYLSATWSNGRALGFGVWVHPACFGGLLDAGTPAPFPW